MTFYEIEGKTNTATDERVSEGLQQPDVHRRRAILYSLQNDESTEQPTLRGESDVAEFSDP
jgi:hypothetical protein